MPPPPSAPRLRLASGVGLVAANMIGAGVFLSAGFMAQDMGPGPILLAWVAGALLALCGAVAYGAVARLVPRSGGEYRYLSELVHPAAGYLAGWASLLVGFSAPIAVDALAAGAFARTVVPGLDPTLTGAALVVLLTAFHAAGFRTSTRTQDVLVVVKAALLAGFVLVGLGLGARAWPTWLPPGAAPGGGFPVGAFAGSLFFIAFAFSGWNAAVYAAEEFEAPERTVPRAMLVGTSLVALLYLTVNWIFVANLAPAEAAVVFRYEADQVTLGHAVMARLMGPWAGALWSAATVLVFLSAMSAMIFLGPRVYAAMARDGFLPRFLAASPHGHPPRAAILLQGALALLIVFTQGLRGALGQVGAVLVLFAALTALGLVLARLRGRTPAPSLAALLAAAVYVASSAWMFWRAFGEAPVVLAWVAGAAAVGLLAYGLSRGRGAAARA
ncbi:MAG: amino acid permease [Anaeromyxobacter sp.]|nr:amino acid permease [Anaeromyxobacter sp.]MBL0275365.1 amino acid permease [Anaeromyxobacter sp.]